MSLTSFWVKLNWTKRQSLVSLTCNSRRKHWDSFLETGKKNSTLFVFGWFSLLFFFFFLLLLLCFFVFSVVFSRFSCFQERINEGKRPRYFPSRYGKFMGVNRTIGSKQFVLSYEVQEIMTSMVTLQISADDIILVYNRLAVTWSDFMTPSICG